VKSETVKSEKGPAHLGAGDCHGFSGEYPEERLERLDAEERAILAQASELLERMLEDGGE
jgi:hypothetical protein